MIPSFVTTTSSCSVPLLKTVPGLSPRSLKAADYLLSCSTCPEVFPLLLHRGYEVSCFMPFTTEQYSNVQYEYLTGLLGKGYLDEQPVICSTIVALPCLQPVTSAQDISEQHDMT